MLKNEIILKQIDCDIYNIQQLVDMLPLSESKGEYSTIVAQIKRMVKEIRYQKQEISSNIYQKEYKNHLPLFEVEMPELEFTDMSNLSSFFGEIH